LSERHPVRPTHIEHIGIAVRDLSASIAFYEKVLGLTCYGVEEVADQKVRTAFFRLGETKIELLEPTEPEGPIGKFKLTPDNDAIPVQTWTYEGICRELVGGSTEGRQALGAVRVPVGEAAAGEPQGGDVEPPQDRG